MQKKEDKKVKKRKELYADLMLFVCKFYKISYPESMSRNLRISLKHINAKYPATFLYVCSKLSDQPIKKILENYMDKVMAKKRAELWVDYINKFEIVPHRGEQIIKKLQKDLHYEKFNNDL